LAQGVLATKAAAALLWLFCPCIFSTCDSILDTMANLFLEVLLLFMLRAFNAAGSAECLVACTEISQACIDAGALTSSCPNMAECATADDIAQLPFNDARDKDCAMVDPTGCRAEATALGETPGCFSSACRMKFDTALKCFEQTPACRKEATGLPSDPVDTFGVIAGKFNCSSGTTSTPTTTKTTQMETSDGARQAAASILLITAVVEMLF